MIEDISNEKEINYPIIFKKWFLNYDNQRSASSKNNEEFTN